MPDLLLYKIYSLLKQYILNISLVKLFTNFIGDHDLSTLISVSLPITVFYFCILSHIFLSILRFWFSSPTVIFFTLSSFPLNHLYFYLFCPHSQISICFFKEWASELISIVYVFWPDMCCNLQQINRTYAVQCAVYKVYTVASPGILRHQVH